MRNSITSLQLPEGFMYQSSDYDKPTNHLSIASIDLDPRNAELENELTKQKAAAEKNAKLIQKIWGDNFQSDSLH